MSEAKQHHTVESVEISVVIATYNGSEYIERCLESFTDQSIGIEKYEVIVVNNNSSDQTADIVGKYIQEYDNFFLVDENTPGVSHARNKGISLARGRFISFIDDDAYADKDWLWNIWGAFNSQSPEPAVVGGRILPYYTTEKPHWFNDSFEIRTKGQTARYLSSSECDFGFPESNLSIAKKVLDEVGVFSANYGPAGTKMRFGEGAELASRISNKYPYFWYDPDIFVYHLVPARNMSVSYILARRYQSARTYQSLRSPSEGFFKNLFVLFSCLIRILFYAVLSVLFVRWWTRKAVSDWLSHVIELVNCFSRSVFLFRYLLGLEPAPTI